MSNYNETENDFGAKLKKICTNRAVVVTVLTMLVAVAIVVAVTISANRSKQPTIDPNDTMSVGEGTGTTSTPSGVGQETLPTYHGQESKPVINDQPDEPTFELPVSGKLFKDHDATIQVYSATMGDYRVHLGIDIGTVAGAAVSAMADGVITQVWEDVSMGQCVAVKHDGECYTIYKNLSAELPSGTVVGAALKAGDVIGHVGESAMVEVAEEPHLHLEMTVNGLQVDPTDYLDEDAMATLGEDPNFEDAS